MVKNWKTQVNKKFNNGKRFISKHIDEAKKLTLVGNFIEANKHLETSIKLIQELKKELYIRKEVYK